MKANMESLRILAVDDEEKHLRAMKIILGDKGYEVDLANSGEEALLKLEIKEYDLVITDLKMGGIDGVELLEMISQKYTHTEVIIVTGYGSVKNAVEAMKKGAYSYFIKSHDPEELILEIAKIRKLKSLEKDNEILREQQDQDNFLLTSKSRAFRNALDIAKKAAQSNSNILILGESGVGKEVFAKYIHRCSERNRKPFIAVNCHVFSDSLLESELFGHEKGAFTGAIERRKGRFEAAKEGTILLDEIGDISLSTQVKLLRVLEEKSIERIGSNKPIDVNFRLLCATNKDLKEAISEGAFREDLYYRISTIKIEIPPLRDRKEDLPALIDFFISQYSNDLKKGIKSIDDEVMTYLLNYDYPGNVRELKNMIEMLVVLSEKGVIQYKYVKDKIETVVKMESIEDIRPLREVRKEMESKYIEYALNLCEGNMNLTSEKLGMSRRQLFNKITEYNIK